MTKSGDRIRSALNEILSLVQNRDKRVLVCGGRYFGSVPEDTPFSEIRQRREQAERERASLDEALDQVLNTGIGVIIHGGAQGADSLAKDWAKRRGIRDEEYKANWRPNGRKGLLDRSAGPKRNRRMIEEGKPDLVVAFEGGNGTQDMIQKAANAGLPIYRVFV